MARAEPANDERTCTKEYLMSARSDGAAGGPFEQTVDLLAAQTSPFIQPHTVDDRIGLAAL